MVRRRASPREAAEPRLIPADRAEPEWLRRPFGPPRSESRPSGTVRHTTGRGNPVPSQRLGWDARSGKLAPVRDRDIRSATRAQALREHIEDPDTLVIDELGLLHGEARVDIAVVNGELHGFELKSAADTLERLPRQILAYGSVLDRVTLVLAENHYAHAMKLVPAWWGIKLAAMQRDAITLSDHRRAQPNEQVDARSLAMLLWRDEALAELAARENSRRLQTCPRRALYDRLVAALSLDELRECVRSTLKRRRGWRVDASRTSRGD